MRARVLTIGAAALAWSLSTGNAIGSARTVHEAQSLTQAKISLTEGIHLVEQQANGHAVSASYEVPSERAPYYAIEVLRGNGPRLTRYELSPNTGKVQQAGDERFDSLFDRLRPASIGDAATSLARAVQVAEERVGGKATDAAVDRGGAEVIYTIEIARLDGTTSSVKVRGADGTIAAPAD